MSMEFFLNKLPEVVDTSASNKEEIHAFDNKNKYYYLQNGYGFHAIYILEPKGNRDEPLYMRMDRYAEMNYRDQEGNSRHLRINDDPFNSHDSEKCSSISETIVVHPSKKETVTKTVYYSPVGEMMSVSDLNKNDEPTIRQNKETTTVKGGKDVCVKKCAIESIMYGKDNILRVYEVVDEGKKYRLGMLNDAVQYIEVGDGKSYKSYIPTSNGIEVTKKRGKVRNIDMGKVIEFETNESIGLKSDKKIRTNATEFKESQDAFRFIMDTVRENGFDTAPTKEDFKNMKLEYNRTAKALIDENPLDKIEIKEITPTEFKKRSEKHMKQGKVRRKGRQPTNDEITM